MICGRCGRGHAEDARFCSGCGAALVAPATERGTGRIWSVTSRRYDPGIFSWIGDEEWWEIEVSDDAADQFFGGEAVIEEQKFVNVLREIGWELIRTVTADEDERLLYFRRRTS